MKIFLGFIAFLYFSAASAGYTVTWAPPTENTDGSPLTDLAGYELWCIPSDRTYGNPLIIDDPAQTQLVKDWASPAGEWKCKMRSFNTSGQRSADSIEIFWTCVDPDGDGNCDVLKPNAPDPDNPGAGGRVNTFDVTRKGYYTITGPDDDLLTRPDGSTRQVTTRDEAYEWISKDGRDGAFTINPPPYEITYE